MLYNVTGGIKTVQEAYELLKLSAFDIQFLRSCYFLLFQTNDRDL